MIVPFNGLGDIGVIADLQPHELPLNAWSAARNVRFREGFVEKFLGETPVFDPPTITPYFLLPVQAATAYWWIYAGLLKVYVFQGGTHSNITRQTASVDVDYSATADKGWTGCVLGGIPILNNGIDPPQMWNPVGAGQRLLPLDYVTGTSTWASLGHECGAMRSFKNFLVALDVTLGSTRYPHMVKWSHPAVPGAVPASWDPADATKDAGEVDLAQSNGFAVDCLQMRDTNIIYKEDAIWGMQFVGGLSIFRFFPIFQQLGILNKNCAVEYFSGKHLVFAGGDVVVHDGQNMQSILSKRLRRSLFDRINTTYRSRSFVVLDSRYKECWLCYVTGSATLPNEALVWNYETGALTFRELPGLAHAASGLIDLSSVGDTWDQDSAPWDTDGSAWNALGFSLAEPDFLLASALNTKLLKGDTTQQFSGANMTSFVERTGLGVPLSREQPHPDITRRKFLRAIYPRIEGVNGRQVSVRVGYQDKIDGSVTWLAPMQYTIGSTRRLDLRVSGYLFSTRFETTDDTDWRLHGYDLDVDAMGV